MTTTFELEFRDGDHRGVRLVRTHFKHQDRGREYKSEMFGTDEAAPPNAKRFQWWAGVVKGMAVCFLRSKSWMQGKAERNKSAIHFQYRKDQSGLAGTFSDAARRTDDSSKSGPLPAMFACDPKDGAAPSLKFLFETKPSGEWVALDYDRWNHASIAVILNGESISDEETLEGLAGRIEEQAKNGKEDQLAAHQEPGMSKPCVMKIHGETLFNFFFPHLAHRHATFVALVTGPRSPYDNPTLYHIGAGLGRNAKDVWFDEEGNSLSPAANEDGECLTLCLVGRPSRFRQCREVYRLTSPTPELILPKTQLRLPETTPATAGFSKKSPFKNHELICSNGFHCVEEFDRDFKLLKTHPVRRIPARPDQKEKWIDYALIQRFRATDSPITIVVLAGCISLGTFAAVKQATSLRFKDVAVEVPVLQESMVEILLEVPAPLLSEPTDYLAAKIPWQPEAYYVKRLYVDHQLVYPAGEVAT